MFLNIAAPSPPLLVAAKSHATFTNCLFRALHLPRSEVIDLSFGGSVTLRYCRFADVSAARGLVDTSSNDYQTLDEYNGNYDEYGQKDHAYEIEQEPASVGDWQTFGAEWVVSNTTVSDCIGGVENWEDGIVRDLAPGCPVEAIARQRAKFTGHLPPAAGITRNETASVAVTARMPSVDPEARLDDVNPMDYYVFEDETHDYHSSGVEEGLAAAEETGNRSAAPPAEGPDGGSASAAAMKHAQRTMEGRRGVELSLEDPWISNLMKVR